MNVNDITFGCEFEVTIPSEHAPAVGAYHRGIQVPGLPAGWNAQSDCSIQAESGFVGVEIVSPILKGTDGIAQVKTVCDWFHSIGAKVNKSTGFHVHVGFDRTNAAGLKRLVALVANHELAIYASTGTKARQRERFCKTVREGAESRRIYDNGLPNYADRYTLLNVANLASGTRPTVEFRAFSGTTNPIKAIGYIRMCIGFVQRALSEKRGRKFAKKYPKSVNGGSDAVRRMFKFLGWTGSNATVFGNLIADNVPSIEDSKKEIVRLAKKYDAQE